MRQRRPRRRTEITALTVEGQVRFPTCILPPVSCRASKSPRTLQGIALWPTWLTRFLLLPEKSIVMRYWIFFSFEFNWIDQENVKFLPRYCFHLAFWETKKVPSESMDYLLQLLPAVLQPHSKSPSFNLLPLVWITNCDAWLDSISFEFNWKEKST